MRLLILFLLNAIEFYARRVVVVVFRDCSTLLEFLAHLLLGVARSVCLQGKRKADDGEAQTDLAGAAAAAGGAAEDVDSPSRAKRAKKV